MKPVNGVNTRLVEEDYLIPVTGDGDEEEEIEATQEGAAVSEEDSETQGVTAGDEVEEEDGTPQPDFAETLKKYQNDINKMKSAFQRKETELLKEKSVLEQKLDSLLQSTMDEKDREKYQFEKMQEKVNQLQAERDQMAQEREQMAQFIQWKGFFAEAGLKDSDLDLTNGLAGLTTSGLNAMKNRIKALETQGSTSVKQSTPKKVAKKPPEVAQTASGKVPTIGTLDDAINHFAKGDQERFWRMAETGNASVLKVLNELSEQ